MEPSPLVTNAINILQACIYKSVKTDLSLKSNIAPRVVVVVVVETAHYGKENLLVVLKRSSQLMRKESGVVSYCVAVSGGWWNVGWNG